MATYFTSDNHFNHANIVHLCNRPYRDVQEMNRDMVMKWNARVGKDDIVYHLGDFALGKREEAPLIFDRLNGRKHLLLGNHDRSRKAMLELGFETVQKRGSLYLEGKRLFLAHHPRPSVPETHDYQLCGHVHESWARSGDIINVGVDIRGFQPVTLEELLA